MPNLKHLRVHVDDSRMGRKEFLRKLWPKSKSELGYDKYDKWEKKTPLIKALAKNLPNLKINKGEFEIAHPDSQILFEGDEESLWEIPCNPTRNFLNQCSDSY